MTKTTSKTAKHGKRLIFGVPVSVMGKKETVTTILGWLDGRGSNTKVVLTPTTEQVVMANEANEVGAQLLDDFEQADLCLADTTGIVWADKLISMREGVKPNIGERVSGVDVMQELFSEAVERGKKVFLLGGRGDAAEKAAQALGERLGLREERFAELVGFDPGSSEVARESEEDAMKVVKKINDLRTDLLFVAYGAPMQERWVTRYASVLDVKVAMVVGGSFDVLAGNVSRAPLVMRKIGLEWLWRLLVQPWRWKRQLRLLKFVGLVLFGK